MDWNELKTLVDAAAEGKTLQWKHSLGGWENLDTVEGFLAAGHLSCLVRIKPEQRELSALLRAGAIGEALKGDGYKLTDSDVDRLTERLRNFIDTFKSEPTDGEIEFMLQELIPQEDAG